MKIHCIIQARYGSTRLPGKVVQKIHRKTMVTRVIERCAQSECTNETILAWSGPAPPTDLPANIPTICGSDEPAERFVRTLAKYPCKGFVRVCADSPFIDYAVVDAAARAIVEGADYFLAGKGLVHGNQAEGFNTQAFLNAEPNMTGDEREHLGLWFQRRDRLTVDTPADLERARLIVSRMTKPHTEYTAAECLELLRNEQ